HEEPVSVRYNETTATLDISVYPNPATDYVNIGNPSLQFEKAEIVGINGNILRTYAQNLNRLGVSGLPDGMYLLRLYAGNVIFVKKIILIYYS
ncbi:MAG: T9SS type A sorting domain-containing protein, partial [Bacteroidia bacterium]|nr:T9SS type A sorting domain-containing protein [Bacteroidia bacterium]